MTPRNEWTNLELKYIFSEKNSIDIFKSRHSWQSERHVNIKYPKRSTEEKKIGKKYISKMWGMLKGLTYM